MSYKNPNVWCVICTIFDPKLLILYLQGFASNMNTNTSTKYQPDFNSTQKHNAVDSIVNMQMGKKTV